MATTTAPINVFEYEEAARSLLPPEDYDQIAGGATDEITLLCRIDTRDEAEYFRAGGILPYVLGNLAGAA